MPPSPRTLNPTVLTADGTLVKRSYALIEELGRGATGTVWRARACATGREYAIKILHGDRSCEPKTVARFLQERSILLRLRHENLVSVHDLVTTADGALALVLDLVSGGTLRDLLKQRTTLPPAEAAELLAQVAAGLAVAHEAGIVHRDLKPDNILLAMRADGGARPRLTDFGIARVLDGPRLTTTGAILGTPSYMAPEVIEGEHARPAADIYALGIILYELLTGRPPFDDSSDTAILLRHVRAVVPPPDGVPPRLWALIETCLHRNPKRRPAAKTLADTLRRLAVETADVAALPLRAAEPDAVPGYLTGEPADPAIEPGGRVGRVGHDGTAVRRVPRPRAPEPATPAPAPRAWTPVLALVTTLALAVGGYAAVQSTGHLGGPDRGRASQAPGRGTPAVVPTPDRGGSLPAGGAPSAYPAGSPLPVLEADPQPRSRPLLPLPKPEVFGAWQCTPTYRWALAHPVLGKACHAVGTGVRMIGTMRSAPGVQTDVALLVQDADTEGMAAGPFSCPAMQFNDTNERSCGPFDVNLDRGHRYRIVQQWKYTGFGVLPGGSVTGDPFTW